jgi:hypothetical protein
MLGVPILSSRSKLGFSSMTEENSERRLKQRITSRGGSAAMWALVRREKNG